MEQVNPSLLENANAFRDLTIEFLDQNFDNPIEIPGVEIEKLKTPVRAAEITDFYKMFAAVVSKKVSDESKKLPNLQLIKPLVTHRDSIYESNPSDGLEVITYRVIKRTPGTFGNNSGPGQGPVLRKPQRIDSIDDEEYPGYKVNISIMPVDTLVELCVWHKDHKVADKRALWLENLMLE